MTSLSTRASAWIVALRYEDLPDDVAESTRLRVLDSLGLMLIAGAGPFGPRIRSSVRALGQGDACTIIGSTDRAPPAFAALANGAMAEALQFDDTHNATIIHATSPNVAAALAAAEAAGASGRDFLAAVAGGTELTCRIGLVAPGQFHPRGLHPTGIIGTLGATFAVARLSGLSAEETAAAIGHAGSLASGLLACWEDGTDTQFLHPGWAAHSALAAVAFAQSGLSGPGAVLEGRFGLFRSHVQDKDFTPDFGRVTNRLGIDWESRDMSFKPYPAAHVIHPFLDAVLHLHREADLRAEQVAGITVRIAEYMIPVVCEPVAEKVAPLTPAHGRVSLQYSLAEALHHGRLGGDAYDDASIRDPEILALARKIRFEIDPDAPGTERYKGWVVVDTTDGRRLERVEEHNWGSREKPMTAEDVRDKFRDNAGKALAPDRIDAIIDAADRLADCGDITELTSLCR